MYIMYQGSQRVRAKRCHDTGFCAMLKLDVTFCGRWREGESLMYCIESEISGGEGAEVYIYMPRTPEI